MTQQHEYFEILLMKGVDGELSEKEQQELDAHLETCQDCRREYADFQQIKVATDSIRARILSDAELEPIRERISATPTDALGFLLIALGTLVLVAAGGWFFFTDPSIPLWHRASVGAIAIGFSLLFGKILYKRLRQAPSDPYNKIDM